jgi:hypothetical protein
MASSNSLTIFASISKEFRCDESGRGFVSLRGLGRMSGVKYQSWGKGDSLFSQEIDEYLTESGVEVTAITLSNGVPDFIAAEVIGFYAEEKQSPTAKKFSRAFRAYGLRRAIQDAIGYSVEDAKMYSIDMVVRRSPATWERMFSSTWIEQAELLTKWKWEWSCMGTFINDCVYAYLPTDIVEMLRELNPKKEEGRGRLHKHHQFLQPEIREIVLTHLNEVESLMKAARGNMELFKMLMVNHYGRFKLAGCEDMPLFKTQTVFMIQASNG